MFDKEAIEKDRNNAYAELVKGSYIADFQAAVQTFQNTTKELLEEAKRRHAIVQAADSLLCMPGKRMWVLDDTKTKWDRKSLDFDKLYIRDRAKFNDDGTDNRLELTPETQLDLKESLICSVSYGTRPDSSFGNHAWWYSTGGYAAKVDWITPDMIAKTKEELMARWSNLYIEMRDKYFADYYDNKAKEKAEILSRARAILAANGTNG